MNRGTVAWIAACAVLLVSGGSPVTLSVARGDGEAGRAGRQLGAQTPVDVGQIDLYLGHLNPQLAAHERARIADAVMRCSQDHDLDPALVVGVIERESNARPWARSPKGAVGLMQVMPYMMAVLPVAGSLTSIESNIEAGCWILADNIRRLGEDRGISAYFWGNRIRSADYREGVEEARASFRRRTGS